MKILSIGTIIVGVIVFLCGVFDLLDTCRGHGEKQELLMIIGAAFAALGVAILAWNMKTSD